MPKAPQRLRGKYMEFDETSHCPPFKKCQNVMINFHRRTRRRHRGQRRNPNDSRTCSIEIFDNEQAVDGHLVTVKANRHRLSNLLLRPQRQEVTYTM